MASVGIECPATAATSRWLVTLAFVLSAWLLGSDRAVAQVPWPALQSSIAAVGFAKGTVFESYGTAFCIKSGPTSSTFLTADHVVHPESAPLPDSHLVLLLPSGQPISAVPDNTYHSSAADLALVTVPIGNIPILKIAPASPHSLDAIIAGGVPYVVGQGLFSGDISGVVATPLAGHVITITKQDSLIWYSVEGGSVDQGTSGGPIINPLTGEVYGVVHAYLLGSPINPLSDEARTKLGLTPADTPALSSSYTNLAISRDLVDAFLKSKPITVNLAIPGVRASSASIADVAGELAENGSATAENTLGLMYEYGSGVQRDTAKALHYFMLAADQGNADAQNNVAIIYLFGNGTAVDASRAMEFAELSASSGNAGGENTLGYIYESGFGVLHTPRYDRALALFELAAAQHSADAEFNLGWMYENGLGLPRDADRAIRYYTLSADSGNSDAAHRLGLIYEFGGNATIVDYEKALKYYKEAADHGRSAQAQYHAAYMYEHGEGVRRDVKVARVYYERAAAQGQSNARAALLRLGRLESPADKDNTAPAHLYWFDPVDSCCLGSHLLDNEGNSWTELSAGGTFTLHIAGRTVLDGNSGTILSRLDEHIWIFVPDIDAHGAYPDWIRFSNQGIGGAWGYMERILTES